MPYPLPSIQSSHLNLHVKVHQTKLLNLTVKAAHTSPPNSRMRIRVNGATHLINYNSFLHYYQEGFLLVNGWLLCQSSPNSYLTHKFTLFLQNEFPSPCFCLSAAVTALSLLTAKSQPTMSCGDKWPTCSCHTCIVCDWRTQIPILCCQSKPIHTSCIR